MVGRNSSPSPTATASRRQSWADLLRRCRRRGMAAPVLTVGDGALGFWKALREMFPETREERCWFDKQSNVTAALPNSAHPGALAAIKEICNAEDIDKAQLAIQRLRIRLRVKYRKGSREDRRRHRCATRVLQISGGALGASAHDASDRIDFRHGPVADEGLPRAPGSRARDLPWPTSRSTPCRPLAAGQRTTSGGGCARRGRVPQGETA